MSSSEWSLLFFTLIGQFSAGLIAALFIISILGKDLPVGLMARLITRGLYISAISIAIALLISFLHLSSPLASMFALTNLKSSWLSREILMVSAFAASTFTALAYWRWSKGGRWLIRPLLLTSMALGLGMVFSMGKLYMIPTVPDWDTLATLMNFFSATILLGFSFLLIELQKAFAGENIFRVSRVFLVVIIPALGIKLLAKAFARGDAISENIAFASNITPVVWQALSWVWLLGIGILIRAIHPQPQHKPSTLNTYILIFALFLIGEFAARVIFYSSYFRVGV